MAIKSLLLLSVLAAAVLGGSATLSQRPLYPQGLSSATPDGSVLPRQQSVTSGPGDLSKCNKGECDKVSGTLKATTATYCDMSSTVNICVCSNAPYTVESLASAFAQVPVYLRHNVISVTSISNSATSAYTSAAQITLFSNSPVDPDVLIHESAHAQDGGFSSSSTWLQAINSDSCVPDGYAQTNAVEDYAQVTVAWIYLHASGSLPSPGGSCMQHQLDALSASTANGIQNFKTKADQRNLNSLLC